MVLRSHPSAFPPTCRRNGLPPPPPHVFSPAGVSSSTHHVRHMYTIAHPCGRTETNADARLMSIDPANADARLMSLDPATPGDVSCHVVCCAESRRGHEDPYERHHRRAAVTNVRGPRAAGADRRQGQRWETDREREREGGGGGGDGGCEGYGVA